MRPSIWPWEGALLVHGLHRPARGGGKLHRVCSVLQIAFLKIFCRTSHVLWTGLPGVGPYRLVGFGTGRSAVAVMPSLLFFAWTFRVCFVLLSYILMRHAALRHVALRTSSE